MYSHYINKGKDLSELTNLSPLDRSFYIASMVYEKEYKIQLISQMLGGATNGEK